MYALDYQDGGTTHFVLAMAVPDCFYCKEPQLDEWVEVKLRGEPVPIVSDAPVLCSGELTIQPSWAGEVLEGLYVLSAGSVRPMG